MSAVVVTKVSHMYKNHKLCNYFKDLSPNVVVLDLGVNIQLA